MYGENVMGPSLERGGQCFRWKSPNALVGIPCLECTSNDTVKPRGSELTNWIMRAIRTDSKRPFNHLYFAHFVSRQLGNQSSDPPNSTHQHDRTPRDQGNTPRIPTTLNHCPNRVTVSDWDRVGTLTVEPPPRCCGCMFPLLFRERTIVNFPHRNKESVMEGHANVVVERPLYCFASW